MQIGKFVMGYATLVSALSGCTALAPTPRQTFRATQTVRVPVGDWKSRPVEPCLVGTRNCSSADQPPSGPCMASTARCVAEGTRLMDVVER
jgi:hypothetical protein